MSVAHKRPGHSQKPRMPGRPQSEELDKAILDATLDALSDVGFEALSIADVARRAETTPPAIYRRFADKEQLLLAALEYDLREIADPETDKGSLRADLAWWIQSISGAFSPRRTRIIAGLTFQASTNPEPLELLSGTIDRLGSRRWRAIIDRAVGRGELASSTVPELIGRVPGALAIHFALLQNAPLGDELITELVEAVMLPALLAAARPAGLEADASQTPLPLKP